MTASRVWAAAALVALAVVPWLLARHQRDGAEHPRRRHSSSPKRPQGRKMRMAPITAYMMTMAVSGR